MKTKIAVIGLGYVGLPLALEFARLFDVVGFDINSERVDKMKRQEDPSREIPKHKFENRSIIFTDNILDIKECNVYIVAVPTPIGRGGTPNLKPLLSASRTVGRVISEGDCVVFESTVYPGCTEDDCIPIIEMESSLCRTKDFSFGYSPERINPGDKNRTICDIVKVVSGDTQASSHMIAELYGSIITAGIHVASSIKVAEASKVIENAQRDMNIAFANQLSMIFERIGIDTKSVFDAAATKWNFIPFQPGLVGGHCIGVDPYYLIDKSRRVDVNPKLILSSREVNEGVPAFICDKVTRLLRSKAKNPQNSKVLVQGVTFKENVSDTRNSKVFDLINELNSLGFTTHAVDSFADPKEVESEYGVQLKDFNELNCKYDALIIAVAHTNYVNQDISEISHLVCENGVIVDIKGIVKDSHILEKYSYWRM